MSLVRELLSRGRERLQALVGDRSTHEARLLLSKVLSLEIVSLIAEDGLEVAPSQEREYDQLLERRLKHEPMAYLLGNKEFFSLSFDVDSSVLIPRPESEDLVRLALENVDKESPIRVYDLGTGSGCLAIAFAKHRPKAQVMAVDVCEQALSVAQRNVEKHQIKNVELKRMDLLKEKPDHEVELMISNPPYLSESEKSFLSKDILNFEPSRALFPGEDDLLFYRAIQQNWWPALKPGGVLLLECSTELQRQRILKLDFQSLEKAEEFNCHLLLRKSH